MYCVNFEDRNSRNHNLIHVNTKLKKNWFEHFKKMIGKHYFTGLNKILPHRQAKAKEKLNLSKHIAEISVSMISLRGQV